jgi:hypothetical protein
MRYRDDEDPAFVRAREREMRKIQQSHPWRGIGKRIIAQCLIPVLVVLLIGEAVLYVRARTPLDLPIPVDHSAASPSPHVAKPTRNAP